MLIEGRNALIEALKANVTIEKVYIVKETARAQDVAAMCRAKRIPVTFADKKALDRMSEGHRGFLGISTEFNYTDIEEILAKRGTEPLFLLLLDGIEDPHNMGAIVRTAECAGVDGIVIPRRRSCGVTDTVIKVSCGAASHVKIAKVANLNDVIRKLTDQGVTVVAADMDGESVYCADLKGDLAVVVGSEGYGIHSLTKSLCSKVVSLPQRGRINSLNASVAAGIIVYECLRQRSL